jgi:choline dehydrogenase-like flavoprotein
MPTHDCFVIGGGHNGQVAAAYLARWGKKVLVLERVAEAISPIIDSPPLRMPPRLADLRRWWTYYKHRPGLTPPERLRVRCSQSTLLLTTAHRPLFTAH